MEFLAVGVGGFCGSCFRYLISKVMVKFYPYFPIGTLVSNVLAGLLIGFIIGAERQTAMLPARVKLFLTVGILGGLSTFSTFSLETVKMFEDKNFAGAGGNIFLNVCASLVAVAAGMASAKALLRIV
ncbi:MAG: fluoride efflux transporter CrcB [Synergistaceae bacterium]|jgi:CrcB protein|nr:fluoride efflux transporter CrcB [Synergistaceae bacterium]